MINLTIRTLDSSDHPFSVEDDITVEQLKMLVEEKVGLRYDTLRFIYCGRVLHDENLLADYNVDDKVIHMVTTLPPDERNRNPDAPGGVPSTSSSQSSPNSPGPSSENSSNTLYPERLLQQSPTAARLKTLRKLIKTMRTIFGCLQPHFPTVAHVNDSSSDEFDNIEDDGFLQGLGTDDDDNNPEDPNEVQDGNVETVRQRPEEFARLVGFLHEIETAFIPMRKFYLRWIRSDDSQLTEANIEPRQRIIDLIRTVYHHMAHAFHIVSDINLLSTPTQTRLTSTLQVSAMQEFSREMEQEDDFEQHMAGDPYTFEFEVDSAEMPIGFHHMEQSLLITQVPLNNDIPNIPQPEEMDIIVNIGEIPLPLGADNPPPNSGPILNNEVNQGRVLVRELPGGAQPNFNFIRNILHNINPHNINPHNIIEDELSAMGPYGNHPVPDFDRFLPCNSIFADFESISYYHPVPPRFFSDLTKRDMQIIIRILYVRFERNLPGDDQIMMALLLLWHDAVVVHTRRELTDNQLMSLRRRIQRHFLNALSTVPFATQRTIRPILDQLFNRLRGFFDRVERMGVLLPNVNLVASFLAVLNAFFQPVVRSLLRHEMRRAEDCVAMTRLLYEIGLLLINLCYRGLEDFIKICKAFVIEILSDTSETFCDLAFSIFHNIRHAVARSLLNDTHLPSNYVRYHLYAPPDSSPYNSERDDGGEMYATMRRPRRRRQRRFTHLPRVPGMDEDEDDSPPVERQVFSQESNLVGMESITSSDEMLVPTPAPENVREVATEVLEGPMDNDLSDFYLDGTAQSEPNSESSDDTENSDEGSDTGSVEFFRRIADLDRC
ncbi:uncharacterized protein LOC126978496 isoform X2 [Leptidea sinapis]|uniref:uncharacterized protein LOC126978496 isoform X2 n=1 Tax=Leptidea sinapis TaxID=189913 RepID=UPI00212DD49A|nr:uncharacterized protein LOC126978496 isoform X2 [Leptidea sinapis]